MLNIHQHERVQALIHLALTSNRSAGDQDSSRRTILINKSLMWKVLNCNFAGKDSLFPGHGIFHESFCSDTNYTDHEEHTVETQIFHNPTTEVDISYGGQALPPYSGHTTNQNTQQTEAR